MSLSPKDVTPGMMKQRFARREDLGLSRGEFAVLRRLATPEKIQAYLNATPANHELGGETLLAVREVIRQRRAHCLEGALLAACALWVHGEPPLVLYMHCDSVDWPHVITLFKRGRCWGAISKTNGVPLRYRDPVYRSLRELVMSYFHEYYTRRGRKTLRGYSVPYDLRRMDTRLWVTNPHNGWEVNDKLETLRQFMLVTPRQEKLLARRDKFERTIAKLLEHPKPEPAEKSARAAHGYAARA